eukprot:3415544-Ditylum_brightwellii.AAC.1
MNLLHGTKRINKNTICPAREDLAPIVVALCGSTQWSPSESQSILFEDMVMVEGSENHLIITAE